jgi:acyl-CoA synthetase (AMP-forming)/AMP-acid ligase II
MINAPGSSPVIGAPNRSWMSRLALRGLTGDIGVTLATAGIGPADRVAIVLKNGPEMAAAFLAVAALCAAAPLNPAYPESEFEFYLTDLQPAAIILAAGEAGPAKTVAERLGILVLTLHAGDREAGSFHLQSTRLQTSVRASPAVTGPETIALILHTSGTTARPKMVPLTNANLVASARHIAASLALGPADISFNIMPLFHIHGLIASLTASFHAGGGICCTAGFNAFTFADQLCASGATWYTAVPTMHQTILIRMRSDPNLARPKNLRFVRSSSASLPPQVMQELETIFNVPVIEAYGMTEAAHQMAVNPLPPRRRKPGSVGLAAGPELRIVDEEGAHLPSGSIGEVVIRGPNVMPGYLNNQAANATAFTKDGWFRTGDQGRLDEENYLFLTGRLKEQINRGGEKISPLEIDVVLLDHPAVARACGFAIPHSSLGEEVGAVVVLHPQAAATEGELRAFAATRLAPFKVPRRILIRDEIPVGATGKIQRIDLASRLDLAETV